MLGIVTWLSVTAKAFILLSDISLMSTYIRQRENGLEMRRERMSRWKHRNGVDWVVWLGNSVKAKLFFLLKLSFFTEVCISLPPFKEQKVPVFQSLYEKYLTPEKTGAAWWRRERKNIKSQLLHWYLGRSHRLGAWMPSVPSGMHHAASRSLVSPSCMLLMLLENKTGGLGDGREKTSTENMRLEACKHSSRE